MPWSPAYGQTKMSNKIGFYRRQFRPFDITDYLVDNKGCTIWLKADDHVNHIGNDGGISDGQTVQGWFNSSRAYLDFAWSDGYQQPTWHENMLNGKPAITFDQTIVSPGNNRYGQCLVTQAKENYNIYTPSLFLVGRSRSNGSFCGKGNDNSRGIDNQFGGMSVDHRKLQLLSYAPNYMAWYNGSDNMGSCAVIVDRSQWHIYSIISYQNNYTNLNIDGVDYFQKSIIDNGSFNTGSFCIGTGFTVAVANEGMNCDIAELILLNFTAPNWVKTNIIKYLSDKYALPVTGNVVPAEVSPRQQVTNRTQL